MRLSLNTDPTSTNGLSTGGSPTPASSAAPADPSIVIPFNAPSTGSFEQTLSQAQQGTPVSNVPTPSSTNTPSSSQTVLPQQMPLADPTAQGLVPFSLPSQQLPDASTSTSGLAPFSASSMPSADPTAQGLVPFSGTTPDLSGTASGNGLAPFTGITAQPSAILGVSSGISTLPSQLPVTEPMAEGLVPFSGTPQLPLATPTTQGMVPFVMPSQGYSPYGGFSYYPGTVQGMAVAPIAYMLVPVTAYPGFGAAALPYTAYAPYTGFGNGQAQPNAVASVPSPTPYKASPSAVAGGLLPSTAAPAALTDAAQATTPAGLHVPFNAPVDITQGYGPTSVTEEPPLNGYPHFHTGIDFALPSGTALGAMAPGKVVAAGWDATGYGNRVLIDHGNGLLTLYGHLDQIDVQVGQTVAAGQQIGLSGSTGNSTGPHLHFAVEVNGSWVDPLPYLQQPAAFNAPAAVTPQPVTSAAAVGGGSSAAPQTASTLASTPVANPVSTAPGSADDSPPLSLRQYSGSTLATTLHASAAPSQEQPASQQPANLWRQAQRAIGGIVQPPVATPLVSAITTTVPGAANSAASGTPAVLHGAPGAQPAQSAAALVAPPQQTYAASTAVQGQRTVATPSSSQPIWGTAPVTPTPPAPLTAPPTTAPVTVSTAAASQPASGSLTALIQQVALDTGVPGSLIAAVMQAESSGNPNSVSPSGAKGLMQLMDATAAQYGVSNSFDPQQNLEGGARYLRDLLNQFHGDTSLAVAAYNAGPGAVTRFGGIPPYRETRAYVNRVLQLQQQYATQGA